MRFLQYSAEITFVHISLIAVTSDFALVGCFSALNFLVASTNFQSGLGLDQRWKPVGWTGRSGRDSSTCRSSRLKHRSNSPFLELKNI